MSSATAKAIATAFVWASPAVYLTFGLFKMSLFSNDLTFLAAVALGIGGPTLATLGIWWPTKQQQANNN